ncbi:MAG: DNA repair exonuclease [Ignavibacteriales bacterium]|nr:DNA repair exonuclease [Ignavibacteriales bacterium]
MSLKIILTADVHLGMKFANLPMVQEKLSETRYVTLEKIIGIANERTVDLLVIAGDFFDKINIAKKDIVRSAAILNKFEGKLIAILPGNHDYLIDMNNNPWKEFSDHIGDRILILAEPKEYLLTNYDINGAIYAGPCQSKHSKKNMVDWIRDRNLESSIFNLGVAHGSLEGVSPDPEGKYFPMSEEKLKSFGLDLWLLGHADRLCYPAIPDKLNTIFYPGTPEPNGFNCDHDGSIWYFDINEDKEKKVEKINVGTYKFDHHSFEINNENQFKELLVEYGNEKYKNYLLKLKLTGRIDEELYSKIRNLYQNLKDNFTYLEINTEEIKRKITKQLIDTEFVDNSFPNKLLNELMSDSESLELAYDLFKEIQDEN